MNLLVKDINIYFHYFVFICIGIYSFYLHIKANKIWFIENSLCYRNLVSNGSILHFLIAVFCFYMIFGADKLNFTTNIFLFLIGMCFCKHFNDLLKCAENDEYFFKGGQK